AEDGIRVRTVTGVQTCALPISDDYRRNNPRFQVEILVEVVALEARVVAAIVVRRQILEAREPARQEAAAQWAVRHKADAQLAAGDRKSVVEGNGGGRGCGAQGR